MPVEISDIDDFQFALLNEAGWQSPYSTTNGGPRPRRSGLPVPGPGDSPRTEYDIPMNRWMLLPDEEKQQIIAQHERGQRYRDRQVPPGGGGGAAPAAAPEAPATSARSSRSDDIDPTTAVTRRGDEGWYVVDKYGEPIGVNDGKPYVSEAEAKEKARQIAHRDVSVSYPIKVREVKDEFGNPTGHTVRSGVRAYKRAVKELGVHHVFRPKVVAPEDDRMGQSGYMIVDPEGKAVRGPLKNPDDAKLLAQKLGDGFTVAHNIKPPESKLNAPDVLANANSSDETGFYVVHDQHPELRLDGPFPTEDDARRGMYKVASELSDADIREQGIDPNSHIADRLKKAKTDELSFVHYDKAEEARKKAEAALGAKDQIGGQDKGSHNEKRWNYGELKQEQEKMHAAGDIDPNSPADNNPDPSYIDKDPTLDNLKKVFNPLILDKANPPRKPWTINQVFNAMKPILNQKVKKWASSGFSRDDVLIAGMDGLMKAIIQDRGMSPFPGYAEKWIDNAIMRAKKKGGSMGRSLRSDGWMSGGVTSLETPLGNGDQGEDNIGSTIEDDGSTTERVTCPTCHGAKFDPDDEGVPCTYCHHTGIVGYDRKGRAKLCKRCGGSKMVRHPCPTCEGKGLIVTSVDQGGEHATKTTGGLSVDNGAVQNKRVAIDKKGRQLDDEGYVLNKDGQRETFDEKGKVDPSGQPLKSTPVDYKEVVSVDRSKFKNGLDSQPANADTGEDKPFGGEEEEGIEKRLNDAARLISRLMKASNLSEQQVQTIGLAFGLDSSRKIKGPTEVGRLLGIINGKGKAETNIGVSEKLRKAVKNMRAALRTTKDEELFDWFLEYQKEYHLADLTETDKLDIDEKGRSRGDEAGGWAGIAPWNADAGGAQKSRGNVTRTDEQQEEKEMANNPWYRRPLEKFTPAEHRKAIKDMLALDLVPEHDAQDWLDREKAKTWDQVAPDHLITYHRLLKQALDRSVRPSYEGNNEPEATWHDRETGAPLETAHERSTRLGVAKRDKYTEKNLQYVARGKTAPALNRKEMDELEGELPRPTGTPRAKAAVAQRLARSMGLDPAKIKGTGPDGTLTDDDVKVAAAQRDSLARSGDEEAIGQVAEAFRRCLNGIITMMEDVFYTTLSEEVGSGLMGAEVLNLID
jgi:hypothetical protein